jgi:hypothetical protein
MRLSRVKASTASGGLFFTVNPNDPRAVLGGYFYPLKKIKEYYQS